METQQLNVQVGACTECEICGDKAPVVTRGQCGYREGDKYDIAYCPTCDTAFVDRSTCEITDLSALYQTLYENCDVLPGYSRYSCYSTGVLSTDDPLQYLASSEDVYWSIQRYLFKKRGSVTDRIIEVGCGIGYLTYALWQRGYDIRGIDISKSAIEQATRKFGNHYSRMSVDDVSSSGERYDIVIATEVIEHTPDPVKFLLSLRTLLNPGGEIVLTTPNKSYYPPAVTWDTELPPVHLWWFSETSLRFLARRLDLCVRFIDFRDYNRNYFYVPPVCKKSPTIRLPLLETDSRVRTGIPRTGQGLWAVNWARSLVRCSGMAPLLRRIRARLLSSISGIHGRRAILCAILSDDRSGRFRGDSIGAE